ncbi:MAG: alanine/ornithine racemase family PLP-dependent enzyme [Clostridiales bacterium]|nr:alanine/ornithine racemase family PLP-dependent enzyme [Clostridiales bacterium]
MYPKMIIDLKKLKQNLDAVATITKDEGNCSVMIVTKGLCADLNMVELIAKHPKVDFIADSRIVNIKTYCDMARKNNKKTVLLRVPMHCEVEEVVRYVDLSLNSEISTIRLLNEEAKKVGMKHNILLMIDLGDLREGMFFKDEDMIFDAVKEILKMKNINLQGVGVNLTCYGAIIPKNDNLSLLVDFANRIEDKFDIKLDIVSGGNSSSIYLIGKGELPKGINNLRLGEAFLLGNDTAYENQIPGTTSSTLTLQAQIVELKEKPSLPIGEVGVDAFGQKPYYEDKGLMKRAIIAIGKQDTDLDSMTPLDSDIDIMGGSSDHIILDVTNCKKEYKVGDIVEFKLGYGGMLKNVTSKYIEREYIR